jgi:hypothetical protein
MRCFGVYYDQIPHAGDHSGATIEGGHGLLHAREGGTLLTSVEAGHAHGDAGHESSWWVRDAHPGFRGSHGCCTEEVPVTGCSSNARWRPDT